MLKNVCACVIAAVGLAVGASAVAQPKPIELEFPSWQIEEPGIADYWTELIKAYEAKFPNVKIRKQQVPFREYVDKMTVRFAGNNPPDIVHLPARNFPSFAAQDWLAPLDDRLKTTDVAATWTPLRGEMVWEGKEQGVLLMGYGSILYYNEKLLNDAGVAVPKTPEEWLAAMAFSSSSLVFGTPTLASASIFSL